MEKNQVSELLSRILDLKVGERTIFLYGIFHVGSEDIKGNFFDTYELRPALKIELLESGKYEFVTDLECMQLHDIISDVTKQHNFSRRAKWEAFAGFSIKLKLVEVHLLAEVIGAYFTRYSGEKYKLKALGFSEEELRPKFDNLNHDFLFAKTCSDIERIEKEYNEDLPALRYVKTKLEKNNVPVQK